MKIKLSNLPEQSTSRLRLAVKTPPEHTYIFNESRRPAAIFFLCVAILCAGFVWMAADTYRWQNQDRFTYGALLLGALIVGQASWSYLIRWHRSDFKRLVLINPLYFVRFRFDSLEAIAIPSTTGWDVKHRSDRQGMYAGSEFSFESDSGRKVLKVKGLKRANDLVVALRSFPDLVAEIVGREDKAAMYSLDLLFEWRMREQQFPSAPGSSVAGWRFAWQRLGSSFLAAVIALGAFFFVVDPYNAYCDDQLRWSAAHSSATATAYRLYIASRPGGRHIGDAQAAITNLYLRAAQDYRASAGAAASPGADTVIRMLEYANHTGRYNVLVQFVGDNEIPENIDEMIRSRAGVPDVVPVLPSFTPAMNQAREERILERISGSFGKIIPGDVLHFASGNATPEDIGFRVSYVVNSSGKSVYYPVSQERLPESKRDWYAGISFDWIFNVSIPGDEKPPFGLTLASQPAQLFSVAYTRVAGEDRQMTPTEVYSAMADSAFGDFGSKLLTGLNVQ